LRKLLVEPTSSYEQMERVAVLLADNITGNEETKPGTWTWHPDGYYIRFFPTAYYSTRIEIHVPKGSVAIGREFDPATHIAAPALTGRQRLLMSARYYTDKTSSTPDFPDPVIFELVPAKGNPGDMIKIEGDWFRAESRIFFGDVETDYIRSMNKNEIYVRVPPNAVTAPITVKSPTKETMSAINFTIPPVVWANAITTSLPDAKWPANAEMNGFEPREPKRPMFNLQRTPNGGFVIQPGYYEYAAQSFLIKAGKQTTAPGGGGYLFAPPKGPREDIVMTVLRNAVNRPEIPHSSIQSLITALVKGVKFDQLTAQERATASTLVAPRQLTVLNTDLTTVTATNTGTAVITKSFPEGAWSIHPDGYYVRYKPLDATKTILQIWIPQGSPAVGKEFDPATHVAVPADVTKERIMFTGRGGSGQ
jgi:hypothetical protein